MQTCDAAASPTPLLDRRTPLPAPVPPGRGSRTITLVSAAVLFAVVLAIGLAKPSLLRDAVAALHDRPGVFDAPCTVARIAGTAVSVAGAMVALVMLHECGHIAGGLLVGAITGPASATFVVGCLLNAADLLPVRAGAVTLDGWRIVSLLRDDVWARRWLALITVPAELRKGVAPDELPGALIEALVAVQEDPADTSVAHGVAYAASFFAHDDDRSARLLETSLRFSGHAPAPFRMALMSHAAAFQARRRADLALAWRNDLPPDAPAWLITCSDKAELVEVS